LDRESSEGYRVSILHILSAYVDKRITFKNTIGTIQGNLRQAEALENRRSKNPNSPINNVKLETEEQIVRTIINQSHL